MLCDAAVVSAYGCERRRRELARRFGSACMLLRSLHRCEDKTSKTTSLCSHAFAHTRTSKAESQHSNCTSLVLPAGRISQGHTAVNGLHNDKRAEARRSQFTDAHRPSLSLPFAILLLPAAPLDCSLKLAALALLAATRAGSRGRRQAVDVDELVVHARCGRLLLLAHGTQCIVAVREMPRRASAPASRTAFPIRSEDADSTHPSAAPVLRFLPMVPSRSSNSFSNP